MFRLPVVRLGFAVLAIIAGIGGSLFTCAAASWAQSTTVPDASQDSADGVTRDNPGSEDADSGTNDDPVWGYFLGKTAFLFFHELVATLAQRPDTQTVIETTEKRNQLTSLLLAIEAQKHFGGMALGDAVAGWVVSWRQAQRDDAGNSGADAEKPDDWDSHNITAPQLADLLCTIYGSNPAHYHGLIASGDLASDVATACITGYQQRRSVWVAALQKVGVVLQTATDKNLAQPAAPSLSLDQRSSDAPELADFIGWLSDVAVINNLAVETNRNLALATSINVVVLQCNKASAATDVPAGDMHLCYENLKSAYDAATAQNVEAPPE
jgi:hypothetical protein